MRVVNGVLWAAPNAGAIFWYSFDGVTWFQKAAIATGWYTGAYPGQFAYGNGVYVSVSQATGTAAASLAVDATKFRMPLSPNLSEMDSFYMKVN